MGKQHAGLERLVPPFVAAEATEKEAWVRQVRILDDERFDTAGAIEWFAERVNRAPGTLRRWKRCNVFTDVQLAAALDRTTYVELAGKPELIEKAIAEAWSPDEARVAAGGGDKHGLTPTTLLEQVEKKPELMQALVRDPEARNIMVDAQLRQTASEQIERAMDDAEASDADRPPASPFAGAAQPKSPWSAYWTALAVLANVMDRMSPEAWEQLPDAQIQKVRDTADRYAQFLAALRDAADDRLPEAARK